MSGERSPLGADAPPSAEPATRGIGFMIMSAAQFLATDTVFVGIGVIAAFALLFSLGMRPLECWLVPWKGRG